MGSSRLFADRKSSTAVFSTSSSSLYSKSLILEATRPSAALFQRSPIPPNNASKPTTMTSTLFTMINKKRNSSSSPSYTLENPTVTLYHFETFASQLLEEIAAGFRTSTSPAPTPLSQFQNSQGPLKSTRSKFGAVVPTPSEPSSQLPKKAASTKRHGPLPPTRARLRPAEAKRASLAMPCPDANVFLDNGMDVDTEFTPRSTIQKQVELLINLDNDSSATPDETNPLPAASAQPSPCTARAIIIIAGIKANAEIQGATQAQQE
ncbi:hypothetical protein BU17DRAFT_83655 [Hysterangium stoloniferum]|nr:hypothetical protein BU17DRAFT_83655 [Hysterangium stoloniferum]